MRRDVAKLAAERFDVVVVGGGIYGVCIARDAALRGLSVALVEKGDFGGATSANSHKIVHGGLRYLQHADFRRMRESIRERAAWLRIAPHLVRPQAFLMPTYGHGLRGREALQAALALNDLLSIDRNRGLDRAQQIPRGRMLSAAECLRLAPGIEPQGLSGGALWYDGLMLSSERLLLSTLRSAAARGAVVANYVEAAEVTRSGGRVAGLRVRDLVGDAEIEVRAHGVIDACGPWTPERRTQSRDDTPDLRLAKAINLVTRPIIGDHAVGLARRFRGPDGTMRQDRRLFFLVPWHGRTLVGTKYLPYRGTADGLTISEREIDEFLDEINCAYPSARLERTDVRLVHAGLVPMTVDRSGAVDVELATRHEIRDHALAGMITVTGVKYTTARGVAEAAVDHLLASLGRDAPRSSTAREPLFGGDVDRLDESAVRGSASLSSGTARRLIGCYGSRYGDVVGLCREDAALADPLGAGTEVIGAEIIHAIREEMALHLADVVFRRTELGTAGDPGEEALRRAATFAGRELDWDATRVESELAQVRSQFP